MKLSKKTLGRQGRHSEKETRQGLSVVLKHQTPSPEEKKAGRVAMCLLSADAVYSPN